MAYKMKIGIGALVAGAALLTLVYGVPAQQVLLGVCSGTVGVITQATGLGNVYCTPAVTPPPPAPTVSLTATPAAIIAGASSALGWSSTNATACTASGGWTGAKATSGSQSVTPAVTATYTLACTGAGGSASASATVTVTPQQTGSNPCGLILGGPAIFCDTFDTVNSGIPSRTGALDPNVWGVSRTGGYVNFGQSQYNTWAPTALMSCTGTSVVTAPNDVIVCNGQLREASNDNPTGLFEGGSVTALAMYPKQPFDFAGRTGTVSFDVSNDTRGNHAAWPEFWMSDLPVPAPFAHFDTWSAFPQNGFGVRFSSAAFPGQFGSCPNGNNLTQSRWTVDSASVIRNYVMEDVNGQSVDFGTASNPPLKLTVLDCVISPSDNSGVMNHVEVRVAQGQIDIYATDAGVVASPTTLRKIATITNANLSLTRGLVWIDDVHYNADKQVAFDGTPASTSQSQHTFVWDNVAFDGPFVYRDFSYDALDALTAYTNDGFVAGSVNLGKFAFGGQTTSWNVPNLPANPQASAVRVLFNFDDEYSPIPTALNVIVNGHATSVPWPYPDMAQGTWRTFAVTIPVTYLVAGTNVVQIGSNQNMVVSNVNIVLVDVPGGVPVLPGSNNAYPH